MLWMLFAPRRTFSQWQSAEDAINSMHETRASSGTAPAADASNGQDARPSVSASVHPDSEAVEEACLWLPPDAVKALLHAVEARAACYRAAAAPRLAAVRQDNAGGRTLNAALTLVAEEQQMLEDCLESLRTSYIASPRKKRSRPCDN